jgi:hypothetical protein
VNFATLKNPVVKSTKLQYQNSHKHTLTCPDGKTHIDNGAECGIGHCLVVAEVRVAVSIHKQSAPKFVLQQFSMLEAN